MTCIALETLNARCNEAKCRRDRAQLVPEQGSGQRWGRGRPCELTDLSRDPPAGRPRCRSGEAPRQAWALAGAILEAWVSWTPLLCLRGTPLPLAEGCPCSSSVCASGARTRPAWPQGLARRMHCENYSRPPGCPKPSSLLARPAAWGRPPWPPGSWPRSGACLALATPVARLGARCQDAWVVIGGH